MKRAQNPVALDKMPSFAPDRRERWTTDVLRHADSRLEEHDHRVASRAAEREARVESRARDLAGLTESAVPRGRRVQDAREPDVRMLARPNTSDGNSPWPMARTTWQFAASSKQPHDIARDFKTRTAVNHELTHVTALAAPALDLVGDRDVLIASRSDQWRSRTENALRASSLGRGSGAARGAPPQLNRADFERPATSAALSRVDSAAARAIGRPGASLGEMLSAGARRRLLSMPDAEAVLILAQLAAWNAQQPIMPGGGVPAISRRLVYLLDRAHHGARAVADAAPPRASAPFLNVPKQRSGASELGAYLREHAKDPSKGATELTGVIAARPSSSVSAGGRPDLDPKLTGDARDPANPSRTSLKIGLDPGPPTPRRQAPAAADSGDPRVDTTKFVPTAYYFYGGFTASIDRIGQQRNQPALPHQLALRAPSHQPSVLTKGPQKRTAPWRATQTNGL